MSRSFDDQFQKLFNQESQPKNDPEPVEPSQFSNLVYFDSASYPYSISFELLNKSKIFIAYGQLLSGEFLSEIPKITLTFSNHTVELTGINLESIYYGVMNHIVKEIRQVSSRYKSLSKADESLVFDIVISKNDRTNQNELLD